MRLILTVSLLVSIINANVINYILNADNDKEINECVEGAMEVLMDETCLFFRATTQEEATVTFVQSSNCAWQASNNTIHLNPSCITDASCLQLIASVLEANLPRHKMATHLNQKYNCTEKCTTTCENGGEIQPDCSCKCTYGFNGDKCQALAKEASFTDTSCGVISDSSSGVLQLSTYPDSRPKATFCQWLIKSSDAWGIIDAEVENLGLDDVDVSPSQSCNDLLNFFGTNDVKGNVPCDGSHNVTHIRSTGNWLLIELRTNPFSENSFTGPKIRYSVTKAPSAVHIFSEGMTASSPVTIFSSFFVFLILSVLLF